jgi:hypothetical protein
MLACVSGLCTGDTVKGYEVGIRKQYLVLFVLHTFAYVMCVLCSGEGLDCDLSEGVRGDIE